MSSPNNSGEPPIEALQSIIQQPEVIDTALQQLAFDAAHYIGRTGLRPHREYQEISPIDDAIFSELYDPAQPTLGLRTAYTLYSAPVLAQAAARMRQRGENVCNVVLLPAGAYGQHVIDEETYNATSGVLVDKTGVAYYGPFPKPVSIDIGYASDEILPASINGVELESKLDNKDAVSEKLRAAGVPHASKLASIMSDDREMLSDILNFSVAKGQAIAIKPSSGIQGEGVILFDPSTDDPEPIKQAYEGRLAAPELLVVEELIRSYPLPHKETGTRLDWNLRSMLIGGQAIGAYVRPGAYGGAVNLARGAEPMRLSQALNQANLTPREVRQTKGKLKDLNQTIIELFPAAYMGSDVIVDEQLQPRILELNGERSGGLENITKYGYPAAPRHAMRSLHRFIFEVGGAQPQAIFTPNTREVIRIAKRLPSELLGSAAPLIANLENEADWQPIKPPIYEADGETIDFKKLDEYAEQQPRSLDHQRFCADTLLTALKLVHAVEPTLMSSENLDQATARSNARSLFFHITDELEVDTQAISAATYRSVVGGITEQLMKPLTARDYDTAINHATEPEQALLFLPWTRLVKTQLYLTEQYDLLYTVLRDELENQSLLDESFETSFILKLGERYGGAEADLPDAAIGCMFLAGLHAGRLGRAVGTITALRDEQRTDADRLLGLYGARLVSFGEGTIDKQLGMQLYEQLVEPAVRLHLANDLADLVKVQELLEAFDDAVSVLLQHPFDKQRRSLAYELDHTAEMML